ncbi:MAG TPA: hypothetical protein DCF68_00470 [Cyanothece sp. UBA12306]|nr:hypothetical protein [Cyanothece sp. UBA12306]
MLDPDNYDLFISYHKADEAWVKGYLLDALVSSGVKCYTEKLFPLGANRIDAFEQAIKKSQRTLLVISRSYFGDYSNQYTQLLAQYYGLKTETKRIIPLILEPVDLPLELDSLVPLDATQEEEWEEAVERLCQELQRHQVISQSLPCPYPGMVPFDETNNNYFFGRDEEIKELRRLLRKDPFIAIIGDSGSGKSSLVFAGLIPRWRDQGLVDITAKNQEETTNAKNSCQLKGLVYKLRPGTTPLTELKKTLGSDLTSLKTQVSNDIPRIIIIDQFEEIFTQGQLEAIAFQEKLQELLTLPNCYIILTVRADFYPDLMQSPFWPKIQSHRLEITPLKGQKLRQAIEQPAHKIGVEVAPILMERLIQDAQGEPGILPLIQETMVLLWQYRKRKFLPFSAYETLTTSDTYKKNALQIAIAEHGEATYNHLSPPRQTIARRIFLRLIQFGEGRPHTRRQQTISDLKATQDEPSVFNQTLEHLTENRLLTVSGKLKEAEASVTDYKITVNLSHETLISAWPRLQEWIEQRQVAEQTRRRLVTKTQEWVARGKGSGGLLDLVELEEAKNWKNSLDGEDLGYDQSLLDLIEESQRTIEATANQKVKEFEERIRLEEEALKREKEARKAAQTRNLVMLIGIVVAIVLGSLAEYARIGSELNSIETLSELSNSELTLKRELESLVFAVEAGQKLQSLPWWTKVFSLATNIKFKTIGSLREAMAKTTQINRLEGHSDRVNQISFSADGKLIASGSHDGTINLWNPQGILLESLSQSGRVITVDFSPKGNLLATANDEGTIKIWQVELSAQKVQVSSYKDLPGHQNDSCQEFKKCQINDLKFNPQGTILASGSRDGTIKLWNVTDGTPINTLKEHQNDINHISFSPDGQLLASRSSDKVVKLWNIPSGKVLSTLSEHQRGVTAVAFSPDGQLLVSGDRNGVIKLWNTKTAKLVTEVQRHDGSVYSLNFSPDGQYLASAGEGNFLHLWRNIAGNWELDATLQSHNGGTYSVQFSPNAPRLVTAGEDKMIKVHQIPSPLPITPDQEIDSASLNPDDARTFIMGGWNSFLQLGYRQENTTNYKLDVPLNLNGTFLINVVSFSHDGKQFAVGGENNQLQVWNLDAKNYSIIRVQNTNVTALAFGSRNRKKILATASGLENPVIQLWEHKESAEYKELWNKENHSERINTIALSPNGQILASAGYDGQIILLNVANGETIRLKNELKLKESYSNLLKFTHDGRILASANDDNTIKLWQVKDGTLLGVLEGHQTGVTSLDFSANDEILVSADYNNNIMFWNYGNNQLLKTFRGDNNPSNQIETLSFSADNQVLMIAQRKTGVQFWNLHLETLLSQGCIRLKDYLSIRAKTDSRIGQIFNNCQKKS